MTFAEEYRPDKLCNVVGQQQHVTYLSNWAKEWTDGVPKHRALILYGKAGIGKTSIAHALAHEMGWLIVELNASDQRTAGVINRVAGSASRTGTLDDVDGAHARKLIVIDEADNTHGTHDRGGSKALINLVKNTLQPIIIIVNNFYKLDIELRNICKNLQFKNVSIIETKKLIVNICKKENIEIENKVVEYIAKNSGGDVRAAVNDLESICVGKTKVSFQDVDSNCIDTNGVDENKNKRDVAETIFTFVEKVFKEKDFKKVLELSGHIGENPESTIFWLDENIPLIRKNADELYESYNLLSKADIFLGRVHRRQNYEMWKYANTLICGSGAAGSSRSGFVRYSPPKYFSKLKQSKASRNIKKTIMQKIGNCCHISSNKANNMLWFVKKLMQNTEHATIVSYELDFGIEEIAYLLEDKASSEKVKTIYAVVQELKEDDIEFDEINSVIDNIKEDIIVNTKKDKPKQQMMLENF